MERLRQQLNAKTRPNRELEAEKLTHQERIQSLQTNLQDIQRLKQQLKATKRANKELESEKRTQQETVQELHENVANLSADHQHNVAQLKNSLSLASNDDSQRFAWLRSTDDEKKENDLELVKIVAD
eukprot:488980_1